ncbi:hypothetical protein E2C01_027879 [Portunus trituberculatus]|uniref:Uncharacterized protein n=1 Tax=Portunus trituberculatus TaxID=210409 RepID=A0A5B7EMI6_PORTR|nr:hypothetical protein [Portunus trituberculatus]
MTINIPKLSLPSSVCVSVSALRSSPQNTNDTNYSACLHLAHLCPGSSLSQGGISRKWFREAVRNIFLVFPLAR